MPEIGTISLAAALAAALYAAATFGMAAWRRSEELARRARWASVAVAALETLASLILFYLLGTSDFSVRYVAEYTSRNLPPFYRLVAFWGGQAGSLLLWSWILSILGAVAAYQRFPGQPAMGFAASSVAFAVDVFFLLILNAVTPPFARLSPVPPDGAGLNPLLQNPGMFIHPLTLYVGYVAFAIPFSFAFGALATGNAGRPVWVQAVRSWTLFAWLFLTVGIVYGAQWAYVELGWGGYWGWDPVENASLMPWLTATAFLHSIMAQERRGMYKAWNVILVALTFLLSIFGTYLTRSGILSSVHAFQDSALGQWFFYFLAAATLASIVLIAARWQQLQGEQELESYASKEAGFLFSNLLLMAMAFAVILGTLYPLITRWLGQGEITVGPPFFNQVVVPLGLALVLLMGLCPFLGWRRTNGGQFKESFLAPALVGVVVAVGLALAGIRIPGALVAFAIVAFVLSSLAAELWREASRQALKNGEGVLRALGRLLARERRRYGGHLVHVGVAVMIIGMTGIGFFQVHATQSVQAGQAITVGGYRFAYNGLLEKRQPGRDVVMADLEVSDRQGRPVASLRPEKVFYPDGQNSTEVAIHGNLARDLYVILAGWQADGTTTFQIYVNPLVQWMWIGEYLLVVGTLLALWPGRRPRLQGSGADGAAAGSGGDDGGSGAGLARGAC